MTITFMALTLLLEPQKEARLSALAQAKGVSADDLVREAVDKLLDETDKRGGPKAPTLLSARSLCQIRTRAVC